ncbi:methyltransferase domain-containing protein [Candidatus Woesearchaeota archaeon]|nr:MAG: methyltransferase domain-containing protein [Candidatus Woesearchaeota archaeon]
MKYYDEISSGYNELYKEEQLKKLELISEHFTPKPIMLDIGAGTGISTSFFNVKSVALDPSEQLLSYYNGEKVVAQAESIPYPDNYFSSIISVTALHHADIDKAIKEIKRVSKPGCVYAFSILKRSKDFKEIVFKLKQNFKLKEIDEGKDLILVSP